MRELFTKSFWQKVKKTYQEALENPASEAAASQDPGGGEPKATSPSAASPSSAASGENGNQ